MRWKPLFFTVLALLSPGFASATCEDELKVGAARFEIDAAAKQHILYGDIRQKRTQDGNTSAIAGGLHTNAGLRAFVESRQDLVLLASS